MAGQEQAISTALVSRAPGELLLSDDEVRRTYRIAEALAASGMWKDVKSAEAAFGKMVIGRDLGLTPAQSMQGIHLVEGGIQMHYATLGQFVRLREGYDYRAGWIKEEPRLDVGKVDEETGEVRPTPPERDFVWHDEEDPLDDRPIVGAVIVFYVEEKQRGVSRFTLDDAHAANLIKADKPSQAWKAAQRNMLLARAMSNGVKWFVPEVMAGIPVYVEGEIPTRPSLTEPVGNGGDEAQGIDLGPRVEKIIERAERLGHRGLSNRAALEVALGNRAPGPVNDWVKRAVEELDRFEIERRAKDVVAEESVDAPEEVVDAKPVEDAEPSVEEGGISANDDGEPEGAWQAPDDPEVAVLRHRLARLNEIDAVGVDEEQADAISAEIEMIEGKLREKGVDPEEAP